MSFFKKSNNNTSPLIIQNYIGYASPSSLFMKGRVLENEGILDGKSDSYIRNLIDNFKRFESDEVPGAKVKITIKNRTYNVTTDREGYFTLDTEWDYVLENNSNWISATVETIGVPPTIADIYYASNKAKYGVITDIDDTVLKTDVTSLFKLKMLYATFFKDGHQRIPMEGIVDLFSAFSKGNNPIFYISHSPWNIFDVLVEFMEVNNLPKGPILLRDFGIKPIGNFQNHKIESIKRILKNHPSLPFVMLGDTAAEDADFYIDIAHEFESQIKAIYIRQTKMNKNAKRVKKLVEKHSHHNTQVILTEHSSEMIKHAKQIGLI